jgi:hypothetical protein
MIKKKLKIYKNYKTTKYQTDRTVPKFHRNKGKLDTPSTHAYDHSVDSYSLMYYDAPFVSV